MSIIVESYARSVIATGSLVATKPLGVSDNDWLCIPIGRDDNVINVTLPSGWNLVSSIAEVLEASGDDRSMLIAVKKIVDAGSEPVDYTFTWSGDSSEPSVGSIFRFSGVDATTFEDVAYVEVTHYATQNSSDAPNAVAITTNTNAAVVLIFASGTRSISTTDPDLSGASVPAGYSGIGGITGAGYDDSGTGSRDVLWLCAIKEVTTAGVETPAPWTGLTNALNDFSVMTIAIKPAVAPGGGVLPVIAHHRQLNFS